MSKRKHMSLAVKLEAAIYQLGLDPKDVQYDHDPALGMRPRDAVTGLYDPDENDPRYIVLRSSAEHKKKTTGREGLKGTVVNGDIHKIAKGKRLEKKYEEHRRRLLSKSESKPEQTGKKKWNWPKRKFQNKKR